MTRKILFICDGNVGRSQIAEGYYNYLTNSQGAISAGIDPTTPLKYKHPTKEITDVMLEEDIDLSRKEVKFINGQMLKNSDNVYIMINQSKCPDYVRRYKKAIYWKVTDPFNLDVNSIRIIRDEIKNKVLSIIK